VVDNKEQAAYGMPENSLIVHWNGPVLSVNDRFNAHNCKVIVKYTGENVLESGLLTGEKLIANQGVLIKVNKGKGEVYLYGFSPQWRAQTSGTFKLLYNMMYK